MVMILSLNCINTLENVVWYNNNKITVLLYFLTNKCEATELKKVIAIFLSNSLEIAKLHGEKNHNYLFIFSACGGNKLQYIRDFFEKHFRILLTPNFLVVYLNENIHRQIMCKFLANKKLWIVKIRYDVTAIEWTTEIWYLPWLRISEWMKVMTEQKKTVELLLFVLSSTKSLLLCCCCSRTVQCGELQSGLWIKQSHRKHVLCCRKLMWAVNAVSTTGSPRGQSAECVSSDLPWLPSQQGTPPADSTAV